MKTIILGKERPSTFDHQRGEVYQSFHHKASQTGVSHKHAIIMIDDNGDWWLEDRWSTNGTYIREDDGSFRKIGDKEYPGKCKITPMTFIRLGIDDSTGCCFYAKRAYKNVGFDEDFELIRDMHTELNKNEKKQKNKIKIYSFIIEYLLPFTLLIVIFVVVKPYAEKIGGFIATLVSGLGFGFAMLIGRIAKSFYGAQGKQKEVEKRTRDQKKKFSYCPNPECTHILSDAEVSLLQCGICKIRHN